MEPAVIGVIIGAVTIVVNILVLSIGGTWKLSELKASLVKEIHESKEEVEAGHAKYVREVGESLSALREKVREVELYCRDTFMRRDSFYEVNRANTEALKALGEKIEARLERMEAKIDARK